MSLDSVRTFLSSTRPTFDVVVPAAGSPHTALRIAPERLVELTHAEWVDVAQG